MSRSLFCCSAKTAVTVLFWCLLVSSCLIAPVASQAANNATTGAGTTTTPPTALSTFEGWQGCNDPVTGYQLVTIGQPTTICVVLANSPNWTEKMQYMRLNFQPIADEYSRFHVPQSYQQLVSETETGLTRVFWGNVTVHVESQQALSYQKWYFDGGSTVFPFMTAIIDVKDGVVTGITWDDGCLFCAANDCQPTLYDFEGNLATEEEARQPIGGCGVLTPECAALNENGVGCDLLIYTVWTGTDSQGKDFRSSAYRFSAFPAQSWTDRISQNLPDWVPQSTEEVQDLNPLNQG